MKAKFTNERNAWIRIHLDGHLYSEKEKQITLILNFMYYFLKGLKLYLILYWSQVSKNDSVLYIFHSSKKKCNPFIEDITYSAVVV